MGIGVKRVAIIGAAQTKHVSRRYDMGLSELIFEAASTALDDAGLSRDEIDSVVLAAYDQIDGRGISTMVTEGVFSGKLEQVLGI